MDAKALKAQEDRQLVLNALAQHGGSAGISVPTLKLHLPFRKETVAQPQGYGVAGRCSIEMLALVN
jgi:hypothetical protein